MTLLFMFNIAIYINIRHRLTPSLDATIYFARACLISCRFDISPFWRLRLHDADVAASLLPCAMIDAAIIATLLMLEGCC